LKTIGKYEIKGMLGRGGMGVVYKALLPIVKKIVALKMLAPHPTTLGLLGEGEVRRRFVAEAETMASLRHPNVVDVLDFDYQGGRPFFTMEYYYRSLGSIIGETYRTESPSRVLSLDKAIHYTRQILTGLSRLHRAGIVHRDIKPFNLLVTEEDRLKIGDFGLSRLRGERTGPPSGLMFGSPFYAAPEQEKEPDRVDARADLYPVGIILYRMLAGRLPGEDAPPVSECHPDVDQSWDRFVEKAIQEDPDKRFASSDDMREELERLTAIWIGKKAELCRMAVPLDVPMDLGTAPPVAALRAIPVRVNPMQASRVFDCDGLFRPRTKREGRFRIFRDAIVLDSLNGLAWQKGGSEDPLDWLEARAYAERLDASALGGFSGWRLPTVNELFTILKPAVHGATDCLDGPFDRDRTWLWSADRRSFVAAWYVNVELGFATWGDFTCRSYVRAVCACRGDGPGVLQGAPESGPR
jgi:hypothetical protein